MTMTDPIADMLTRIRNALLVRHPDVDVPSSKVKVSIAEILKSEGYISDYSISRQKTQSWLRLQLHYRVNQEPGIAGLSGSANRACVSMCRRRTCRAPSVASASPSSLRRRGS